MLQPRNFSAWTCCLPAIQRAVLVGGTTALDCDCLKTDKRSSELRFAPLDVVLWNITDAEFRSSLLCVTVPTTLSLRGFGDYCFQLSSSVDEKKWPNMMTVCEREFKAARAQSHLFSIETDAASLSFDQRTGAVDQDATGHAHPARGRVYDVGVRQDERQGESRDDCDGRNKVSKVQSGTVEMERRSTREVATPSARPLSSSTWGKNPGAARTCCLL